MENLKLIGLTNAERAIGAYVYLSEKIPLRWLNQEETVSMISQWIDQGMTNNDICHAWIQTLADHKKAEGN